MNDYLQGSQLRAASGVTLWAQTLLPDSPLAEPNWYDPETTDYEQLHEWAHALAMLFSKHVASGSNQEMDGFDALSELVEERLIAARVHLDQGAGPPET